MSQGVFTRLKRVTFVKGWLTGGTDPADGSGECGPGSRYQMEVTRDQLEELYYRARESSLEMLFESGSVSMAVNVFFGGPLSEGHYLSHAPGSAPYGVTQGDTTFANQRGYTRTYSTSTVAPIPYHDPPYVHDDPAHSSVDAVSEPAIWWDNLTDGFPFPTFAIGSAKEDQIIRTGVSIWMGAYHSSGSGHAELPPWRHCYVLYGHTFTIPDSDPPEEDTIPLYMPVSAQTSLVSVVAWIDVDGSGDPLSPGNRLFVGVHFSVFSDFAGGPMLTAAAAPTFEWDEIDPTGYLDNPWILAGDLTYHLSNGQTLTIPLYTYDGNSYGPDPWYGSAHIYVDSWWPYAKGNPAVPVWDTTTGLPAT